MKKQRDKSDKLYLQKTGNILLHDSILNVL